MSLFDTIQGARDEAAANTAERRSSGSDDEAQKTTEDAESDKPKGGFAKRSVARAKPAREAAANVRVVSSTGRTKSKGGKVAPATKEERKAERAREREELDREDAVAQILLESDPKYKPRRRVWWTLIGIGFATMACSLVPTAIDSAQAQDYSSPLGIASIIFMIICYVTIISAFIYDFVKIRPMRKATQGAASGLTRKAMQKVLDDDRRKHAAERAEKEAKKGK